MSASHVPSAQHPLDFFRFCPHCGSAQFLVHDARSKRCGACGFTFYQNAAAATVAVIVNERGELLVTRRALDPARGTLDLPGGFVDPGESVTDGVVREVEEETGGKAVVDGLLFSLPNRYVYSGFTVDTSDLFFACHLREGDVLRANDDAQALMWLPLKDVRPADFGLTSIRRGVERILKHYSDKF